MNKWDRRDRKKRKRKDFHTDNRKSVRNIVNLWAKKISSIKKKEKQCD